MNLVRINRIRDKKKAAKYRMRIWSGSVKKYIDVDGFVCFDSDEMKQYEKKKKKAGRPPKMEENSNE